MRELFTGEQLSKSRIAGDCEHIWTTFFFKFVKKRKIRYYLLCTFYQALQDLISHPPPKQKVHIVNL